MKKAVQCERKQRDVQESDYLREEAVAHSSKLAFDASG